MKQDLVAFKNDFNSSLSCLKIALTRNSTILISQLDQIESNIQKSIADVVNKSIMSIKDSIIDALKKKT